MGWIGETARVVQTEVGPQALLTKYTWLKEAHAQLNKKRADMAVYAARNQTLIDSYKGVARASWPREDREQWATWQSELAGIKASYNDLAAQYNAKMAEVNWRFTNVGMLPSGASEPLPREYAPYTFVAPGQTTERCLLQARRKKGKKMDAVQKVRDLMNKALHEGTPEKERNECAIAAIRIIDRYELLGRKRVDVAASILQKIMQPDFMDGLADRAERFASGVERVMTSAKKVSGHLTREVGGSRGRRSRTGAGRRSR